MAPWLAILLGVLAVVFIWFLVSTIWGKPWSINLFYTHIFLEVMFDNPELISDPAAREAVYRAASPGQRCC